MDEETRPFYHSLSPNRSEPGDATEVLLREAGREIHDAHRPVSGVASVGDSGDGECRAEEILAVAATEHAFIDDERDDDPARVLRPIVDVLTRAPDPSALARHAAEGRAAATPRVPHRPARSRVGHMAPRAGVQAGRACERPERLRLLEEAHRLPHSAATTRSEATFHDLRVVLRLSPGEVHLSQDLGGKFPCTAGSCDEEKEGDSGE